MPRGEERLVPAPETAPASTTPVDIVPSGELTPQAIQKAQELASLHRQLRVAALKVTTARDWVDLDGQPYLSASGCHRLAALFRIRQRNVRTERLAQPDGSYTIVVVADACSEVLDPQGWVEVVGTASSDDRFLTKGGKVKAAFGDVLKKAHTNWFGRAIRQLVGLSGLSWDELEAMGISRAEAPKVEYAKAPDEEADLVWLQVPFKEKDRFRELVRQLAGHSPKWDGQKKAWGVPAEIAEHPDIKALLGQTPTPPTGETLFGGGK